MTQTPLDLEREEEWGGEKKKTRGEDKEDKEVGEEERLSPKLKSQRRAFQFSTM